MPLSVDGAPETLELKRFEVFAKDAEITVFGANDEVLDQLPAPALRYYRGRIAGEADSLVFLTVDAEERVEGIVYKGDRRFDIESRARKAGSGFDVFIQEGDPMDALPLDGTGFVCDVEKASVAHRPTLAEVVKDLPARTPVNTAAFSSSPRRLINLAIETDYEYTNRRGGASPNSNVPYYVGWLIGGLAAIYDRDLNADVVVTYLGIHASPDDPFTVLPGATGLWNGSTVTYTPFHALLEFGDRWHHSPPSDQPRSTTVLLSHKTGTALGSAWTDVLCAPDFLCQNGSCGDPAADGHYGGRYAFLTEALSFDFSYADPNANPPSYTAQDSNYQTLYQLAHETGHNVYSGHTHCKLLSPADQATYSRTYVDQCFSGAPGCFSGTPSVPPEKGTLMSYCQKVAPASGANIRFTYGKDGEANHVMRDELRAAIEAATPPLLAIAAPGSVPPGGTGVASAGSIAGMSYLWSITNGTINSGQGTSAINFTATAHPVTLNLKITNTWGCSVTDSENVAVAAGDGSRVLYDFDGDRLADVLWRETASGATLEWLMSGASAAAAAVHSGGNTAFGIAGIEDFDADGKNDILWRHNSTGQTVLWFMNGPVIANSSAVHPGGNSAFTVASVGDFDGDGNADILWRQTSTGQLYLWLMDGAVITASINVHPGGNTGWSLVGSADFNGDGKNDILWRNNTTGQTLLWIMNGGSITSSTSIHSGGNTALSVRGLGDINGDGMADILWRHGTTGAVSYWQMSSAQIVSQVPIHNGVSLSWSIAAVADYDGDSDVDLLWRHSGSGETVMWFLGPGGITSTANVHHGSNTGWNVIATR